MLNRRTALATIGGVGISTFFAACASKSKAASDATATTTAAASTSIVLAPEMTEGPFYRDLNLFRSDITEDRAGVPLALVLRVIDVDTKAPIKSATVDIWHCDANGLYSGFVAQSAGANSGSASTADDGKFLRGSQITDAQGAATFRTIYPGWYAGRAVHIHIKVHVGGSFVHTGQLFFDDALTDKVFAANAPYSSRSARDTRNNTDSIYSDGGDRSTLLVQKVGRTYASDSAVGVNVA